MKKFILFAVAAVVLFAGCGQKKERSVKSRSFTGEELKTIGFPIGGIGTGDIILGGRGDIKNLEIFNKPDKNKTPYMTFFCIWAKKGKDKPVSKILEREYFPPFDGSWGGFNRDQLSGVSRFREATFRGEFPFAYLSLKDDEMPVSVELEAYNPLVPLSVEKSGVPAAIFNWKIKNNSDEDVTVSIALNMSNPALKIEKAVNINEYVEASSYKGVMMTSDKNNPDSLSYGSIFFATTEKNVDVQTSWYKGGWWDNVHMFWDDFSDDGRLKNYTDTSGSGLTRFDQVDNVASLLVPVKLKPGEEKIIPFYITWYFPNNKFRNKNSFKNYYSTLYDGAADVSDYLIQNVGGLYSETKKFHDILFCSSYPSYVIDAVSSQISTIKTNMLMLNEKCDVHGFEGLCDNTGCCMGTCTHVWNYAQTLAFLFPSLERKMREISFLDNTTDNGYQSFRYFFPPGNGLWKFHPAADGQMGNIVRVYREWKLSGDNEWLKNMWPKVKASLEFAWNGVGELKDTSFRWEKESHPLPWDADKDGVMEGMQHNTYDIEFFGPNTMCGSLYLAALKACSEMAAAMGEPDKANEYIEIYNKGSKKYDEMLWNGDYYIQKVYVDKNEKIRKELQMPEDTTMPKYQYGEGCLSDQLLGQYLAFVTGLGYVMKEDHVNKALYSIYKNNYLSNIRDFSNVQRVYALNNEAGLLLCSWPKGNRPKLPFVYSDEVWTGIEYQVAASLIYAGYTNEGLNIVESVRDRYAGDNRNPWGELECGYHYARAMASWAVMLALSDYQYDGVKHFMAFSPKINKNSFYTFWSTGDAWGSVEIEKNTVKLKVEYGYLYLSDFGVSADYKFKSVKDIEINSSQQIPVVLKNGRDLSIVHFSNTIELNKNDELVITFGK